MKNTNKIFTTFLITLVAMHGAYAAGGGKGSAVLAAIGQKIEDKVHENTDKKINKANEKKDVSATTTFMNNRLKIDKAFTKRYNELLPKGCGAGPVPECKDGGGHELTAESTNKTNKKSLEHYEQQMMRATSVQALGEIYACAIKDYEKCHYIGGAGSTAKTINGTAKAVDKLSMGKTNISDAMGGDVRNIIMSDKGTQLNTDGSCETNVVNSASSTSNDYLNRLSKCEKIEQVTLSGYTDEDIRKLEDEYKAKKENEQSLANRTLTAGAIATTGIGGMELAMGLSQQKADKDAAQSMAAYIATMRCTYGDGKQVKAGPDEIELPGGNNQQLMNLRAEYFALATDLKERKTALNMKPGIESEEILDKAATGLYDDEMVGITSGAYASLYRAQMLGSEEDQKKIDEEQKASKNRVIAGAVVGGVGVVGSMVGNSLVNGKLGEKIKAKKQKRSEDADKTELTEEEAKKIVPVEKADTKISKSAITAEGEDYKYIKSFNLDDTCSYETQTDAIEGSEELDLCKGLQKGEWLAKFSYGIVKGKASCNDTEGDDYCAYYSSPQGANSSCVNDVVTKENFARPSSEFKTNSTGKYCWCQTTNIGSSSSNWVFESEYADEAACTRDCANVCADYFNAPNFQEFTNEILSSVKD